MNSLYFSKRKYVIGGFILVSGIIFLIRIFYLQVIDYSFRISAESNVFRSVTQYPARGLIYDRKGKLIVYNEAAYDLKVVPNQLRQFDTTLMCSMLGISKSVLKNEIIKAYIYSRYKPSVVAKQIPAKKCALIQEKLHKFPGFSIQPRSLRRYTTSSAAHILGYVGEVTEKTIKANSYYKTGDYIGVNGIENAYEEILRGKKGVNIFLVDVHNNIKGSFQNGRFDTMAVVGSNITTSIDTELQEYGEMLMKNKTGSIVVIEPSSGEILALISSPSYNPNLLVGNDRSENYNRLYYDHLKPLFNRALQAQYPPGSTFKLVNALIALQDGLITNNTVFPCNGGFVMKNHTIKCHHTGNIDFISSIAFSCNSYYCYVFQRMLDNKHYGTIQAGYDNWYKYVRAFGLGLKTETDLSNEISGILHPSEFFIANYGVRYFSAFRIMSVSIGQGELGFTPLQICNMTAAIANRGYYFVPHVIKEIDGQKISIKKFTEKHTIPIDKQYFELVIHAMEKVILVGTATNAVIDGISVCGKTGTAQNPHGEDHSIFVAFAPKNNPKIAISVYVENAGFGSTMAAPIASLMIEKYLKGTVSRTALEEEIINTVVLPKNINK